MHTLTQGIRPPNGSHHHPAHRGRGRHCKLYPSPCAAAKAYIQVLIREGEELGHRLISPLIHRAQKLLGMETESDDDLRGLADEIARLHYREAEDKPAHGLLPSSRSSPRGLENDVRLV